LPGILLLVGYSGAALYDDDTAADVRGLYRELLGDGFAGDTATDTLLAEWAEVLDDPDESSPFWLALADTQWRVGRLEDRVRDRALRIIADGSDLGRFDHDIKLRTRRRKILDELRDRITSPQRSPVRIRPVFRSISPVGRGDVFAYRFDDGRSAYFRAVEIGGDDRDSYPTVEVLDWEHPPTAATADKAVRRLPTRGRTDLITIYRYRSDPDPTRRIILIREETAVDRKRALPACVSSWSDLEDVLASWFGF
jgi:hypothetical protein